MKKQLLPKDFKKKIKTLRPAKSASRPKLDASEILSKIDERSQFIANSVKATLESSFKQIEGVTKEILRWMEDGVIVRVLGAGRARLAASMPANRLAHGGARVFVQDDMMPMPHTIRGGAILAASASGKTAVR